VKVPVHLQEAQASWYNTMRAKFNHKHVHSLVIVHVMIRHNVRGMQLSRVNNLWTYLSYVRGFEATEVVTEDEGE
jgi:hypothetical protein